MRRIRSLREFSVVDTTIAIVAPTHHFSSFVFIFVLQNHAYYYYYYYYFSHFIIITIILFPTGVSSIARFIWYCSLSYSRWYRQFGCILMMCAQKMYYVCVVKQLLPFVIGRRSIENERERIAFSGAATRFRFIKKNSNSTKKCSELSIAVICVRSSPHRILCFLSCILHLMACLPHDTKNVWYVWFEVNMFHLHRWKMLIFADNIKMFHFFRFFM